MSYPTKSPFCETVKPDGTTVISYSRNDNKTAVEAPAQPTKKQKKP